MTVTVLFFSTLQDLTGQAECEETLADDRPWTVGDLLEKLYERIPSLRAWNGRILLAVDQAWAEPGQPLHDGAEVAIMPPVQGG